jgi:hypothetical protein
MCTWRAVSKEAWWVQFGSVGRAHDFTIRIANDDGIGCEEFVVQGHVGSAEMSSAASVGDGWSRWDCAGRTKVRDGGNS